MKLARPGSVASAVVGSVLIVDDEPLVLRSLARFLRPMVPVVHVAGDFHTAAAVIAAQPLEAVVTDEQLGPGLHGSELLRRVARELPFARRILMSGLPLQPGGIAHAFLHKPFLPEHLVAALRVR